MTVKCGITQITSDNYTKIKENSYDSLPLVKQRLLIMLQNLLSQFLVQIRMTTTIPYSYRKLHMNYLKKKFLYRI